MLIADIKIVPHGMWNAVRDIRRVNIANVGQVNDEYYRYACWFSETEDEHFRIPNYDGSDVSVKYFNHRRDDGAEACVVRALDALREE